jgi:hypothetical protein
VRDNNNVLEMTAETFGIELPEPESAYFIGGSEDDAFLSKEKDHIIPWQCDPDTKAGDMIVMYLRTPISAIDPVRRCELTPKS